MLFDIGYADGVTPVLAVPEKPVPNGTRAGMRSRTLPSAYRNQTDDAAAPGIGRDSDHHFASGVACTKIAQRIGGLAEREAPVDNGCDLTGLNQLSQKVQVLLALPG